jgi:hypothetical protein
MELESAGNIADDRIVKGGTISHIGSDLSGGASGPFGWDELGSRVEALRARGNRLHCTGGVASAASLLMDLTAWSDIPGGSE